VSTTKRGRIVRFAEGFSNGIKRSEVLYSICQIRIIQPKLGRRVQIYDVDVFDHQPGCE
jgi:hypothetical protein